MTNDLDFYYSDKKGKIEEDFYYSDKKGKIAEGHFKNLLKKNKTRHIATHLKWWGYYWEDRGIDVRWQFKDGEWIPYVKDLPMQCDFIIGESLLIEVKYCTGATPSGQSYTTAPIEIYATEDFYYSGIMKCGKYLIENDKNNKYDAVLAIWNAHDKQWYFFCAKELWNKYKDQYTGLSKADDGNKDNPGLITRIPWNGSVVGIKREDFVSLVKRHLDKS
jgi:hypothetical protein